MIDSLMALSSIGAAFGLAGSAGLNAYIPLLTVALLARFTSLIPLNPPYSALTNGWVIGVLVVLLAIEVLVDKIPAVDSINDVIQTLIRPTAGAILFAASANVVSEEISPVLTIIAGILVAGSVHATKGVVRPLITASTAGTGNWLVSLLEDIVAVIVSLLSILLPVLMFLVFLIVMLFVGRYFWRRYQRRQKMA